MRVPTWRIYRVTETTERAYGLSYVRATSEKHALDIFMGWLWGENGYGWHGVKPPSRSEFRAELVESA